MRIHEIEAEIDRLQTQIAKLRDEALELPEVRRMTGAWVSGWLEAHGASSQEAKRKIAAVVQANRNADVR